MFSKIVLFISKHLYIIQKGVFLSKLKSAGTLALTFSPFAYILENLTNWSLAHKDYITLVLGAIAIDHILGSLVHLFVKKDFSFKKNITGVLIKISLVVAMGFLFEGVNHIIEEDSFIKSYLSIVLRLTVFLYPAGSAFINSSLVTQGKFPPIGWINKIKNFNQNLDLTEINPDKKEEEPIYNDSEI